MNTKLVDELHKRLDSVERLLKRRDDDVAEMAKTIGQLVTQYQQQGRDLEALRSELRGRPAMPAVAVKPPVVDKHAIVGRVEQHENSPVTVLSGLSPHVEIPTESQFKKLVTIIAGRYPKFAAVDLAEVRRAFIAVGHLNRMPAGKLNMQSGVTGWTDILEDWQRTHSLTGGISGGAVTAAVLMHNDIEYSSLDRWPLDVEFGLHRPYSAEGRKCSNAWKALLHGTELLRGPTPVKRIVDTSIGFQHNIPSW